MGVMELLAELLGGCGWGVVHWGVAGVLGYLAYSEINNGETNTV